MKKIFVLLSFLLFLTHCTAMKSCSKVATTAEQAGIPDTFVMNNRAEPSSMDPALMEDVSGHHIALQIYEGLTEYDPKTLEPVPGVATHWDVSPDGKVYTFHLRKNAKWSNEDEVTANDFEYSWKRVLDPTTASTYAYILYFIQNAEEYNKGKSKDPNSIGVKAIDKYTLQVKLKNPTPFFPTLTAFHTYRPVHKATVEKWQGQWTRPEHFVSNGPYKLISWIPQKEIVVDKNPYYWDQANVKIARLKFLPIEDLDTALKLHLNGDVHFTYELPSLKIPSLKSNPAFQSMPALMTNYYQINTARKPFNDLRVRRALNMAIDKKQVAAVLQKGDFPTTHLVPPGMKGYTPPEGDDFNPEEAKKLLAEAGFSDPKTFPKIAIYYNTDKNHKMVAEVVQNMWKTHLGIEVELINQEWKVLLANFNNKNFDLGRLTWVGDYPDPDTFLELFTSISQQNNTGWRNAEYDDLILNQAPKEMNSQRRMELLQKAEAILIKEMPIIPLYHWNLPIMVDPRLQGFYHNVQDSHPMKFAHFEAPSGAKAQK